MRINQGVLALSLLLITGVSAVAVPATSSAIPDFSMSPSFTSLSILPGQVGAATISLTSLNGFTGNVTLQASSSPSGCAPSCTSWSLSPSNVAIGPANATLGLTLSGTATLIILSGSMGGSGNVTITGIYGSLMHTSTVEYVVPVGVDFGMTSVPAHVAFSMGLSGTSTITVTSYGGFNGTVTLNVATGPGLMAQISPGNLTGSGTATLFLSSPTPGNYTVTVTGTSGSLVRSTAVLVTVTDPRTNPDFTISVRPENVTILPGDSTSSTIFLTSQNSFNGTVTLTVAVSSPMISATSGMTILALRPASSASTSLGIVVSALASPGVYTVTVTGTSGQNAHSVMILVAVPDPDPAPSFSITASPSSLSLVRGSSFSSTITVTSLNNFAGQVSLQSVSSSSGLVTSLSPVSVNVLGGTATSTLAITTAGATLPGSYNVTVTGSSGSLIETVTITVAVTLPPPQPDFTITVSPPQQTIRRGSTTTFTITIVGVNGFDGTVSLSASINPVRNKGPVVSLSSMLASNTNSTLTIVTSRHTQRAAYTITIQATSGTLTHVATVLLTVTN